MLEGIKKQGFSLVEFGRLPEEGQYEYELRLAEFLCSIDASVLADFQKSVAELKAVERRMDEVRYDELYRAHLHGRVKKNNLTHDLFRTVTA